jgi:hypothetical protein
MGKDKLRELAVMLTEINGSISHRDRTQTG